uniref:RNA-dependent RNA polymerase n=1 Tax=Reticulitermes grassei narna-like virus 1 TaxID=3133488 RepID=A0AAT9JA15_9VIRU
MRKGLANILVNRPCKHFYRIEDFINGVIDSLWCAEELVFLLKSSDQKCLIKLLRKIFSVGTFNLNRLVKDWKEWGNHLFLTKTKTVTIGELTPPRYNNIFQSYLNRLEYIRDMIEREEPSFLELQHLSHLMSSRQHPYMGKETEQRSVDQFKSVLTGDFRPTQETIVLLSLAARRIGGLCRAIRNKPINASDAHFSVTSSGEYDYTISKGAQAAAVMDDYRRFYSEVPEVDEEISSPFGTVVYKAGLQKWRTVFRKEPYPEGEFLEKLFEGYPKESYGRFSGLDKVTGKQILFMAWCRLTPNPINTRAEVVPEMGDKARMITITPYWVGVLQAPLSHILVSAMKYHPSVFSSFHRQDQAWEAAKALAKLKHQFGQYPMLSSDLKDATNAQQFDLTRSMLKAFMEGYGLIHNPAYTDAVLGTIGPRFIEFRDSTSVVSTMGIMMGEPITKPSLTLLNLAIEELAFLTHTNRLDLLGSQDPAPYRDWRFLHIGGDDHLAMGPPPYLDLITEYHRKAGSHISPGQHGYSSIAVRYTERVLDIRNLIYREPINHLDYSRSTIVDSVKVRLLERGQSTMIKKDNKNVAIGKSAQIAGCIRWLPRDNRFWNTSKKTSIRDLFINRMGALLPSRAIHPRCFHQILLPKVLGGYDLGLPHEIYPAYLCSTEPIKWLLNKAFMGLDVKNELGYLTRLNSNQSVRGVEGLQQLRTTIVDQLREYPQMVGAISWKELLEKFPPDNDNPRHTEARASDAGWMSFKGFAEYSTRSSLFQELLMGDKSLRMFNTSAYVHTFNRIWTKLEEEGLASFGAEPLCESDFRNILKTLDTDMWFDASQPTSADVGFWDGNPETETYDFVDVPYKELYEMNLPHLQVGLRFLGLNS